MSRSRTLFGILLIAVGSLSIGDALGWWDGSRVAATWWPLLVIGVGAWIVVDAGRGRPPVTAETLRITAIFAGRRVASWATPFRSASAIAVFGGVDLDLRSATIAPQGAFVDATAAFGGVKIIVPPEWNVIMSGPAIFGSNENKTQLRGAPAPLSPVLTVRGLALFGGVEVEAASLPDAQAHPDDAAAPYVRQ